MGDTDLIRSAPELDVAGEKPQETASRQEQVPAYYRRRRRRENEICQILLRNGDVTPEQVRAALRQQDETGGQVGRILVKMGACSEAAISRASIQQLQMLSERGRDRVSLTARDNPQVAGLKVSCSPFLTTVALVTTDIVALASAAAIACLVDLSIAGTTRNFLLFVLPTIGFCIVTFRSKNLYSAMAASAADELRDLTVAISLMSLCGSAFVLALQKWGSFGAVVAMIVWWVLSGFFVPVARALLRLRCAPKPWWGQPVVVLGAGKAGRTLVRTLRAHPSFGLKPVMILDDDRRTHGTLRARVKHDESLEVRSATEARANLVGESARVAARELLGDLARRSFAELSRSEETASDPGQARDSDSSRSSHASAPELRRRPRGMFAEVDGIPVLGEFSLAPVLAKRLRIRYAIIAIPGASSERLLHLTERVGGVFSRILVIPDLLGFASQGVPTRDVGGVLGIEVQQQLLLPGPRLAKRVMDTSLTLLGGLFVLPIVMLLALLIKLDSPGPVFYFQERLGQNGRRFKAAKFRSMYGDGEARLKAVLDSNPQMRAEYEEFHKLTSDPRVTRIGRIVRKYSLDELPQLWNVITGDMSLVGPRPYLEREVPEMAEREKIILRAKPGMTGLWQVSDRNATGFGERLKMDVNYVRNWSPWLDLCVLARTIGVVVKGTGV